MQYWPNVESLLGYLHARQYLPYARTKQFLKDVIGLPIRSRLNRARLQGLKFSTHWLPNIFCYNNCLRSIEGLLFHGYLQIIYPSAIQCQIAYAATNAGTPSLFLACFGPAMFLLNECCCHYQACVRQSCDAGCGRYILSILHTYPLHQPRVA